jgi:hypothetical protein
MAEGVLRHLATVSGLCGEGEGLTWTHGEIQAAGSKRHHDWRSSPPWQGASPNTGGSQWKQSLSLWLVE